jgi:hypothetical protein
MVKESELYRALDWLGARQAAIETALALRNAHFFQIAPLKGPE